MCGILGFCRWWRRNMFWGFSSCRPLARNNGVVSSFRMGKIVYCQPCTIRLQVRIMTSGDVILLIFFYSLKVPGLFILDSISVMVFCTRLHTQSHQIKIISCGIFVESVSELLLLRWIVPMAVRVPHLEDANVSLGRWGTHVDEGTHFDEGTHVD